MPRNINPAGDGAAMDSAMPRLDMLNGPSPRWQDWNLTGPASEHKAMMARFRADHPQDNLPWDYGPP